MRDFLEVALGEPHGMHITAALDSVISAKVLPTLRGADQPELRCPLDDCKQTLSDHGLPRCHKRAGESTDDLKATGSARFRR